MIKFLACLTIFAAALQPAFCEVYSYTNVTSSLSPNNHPMTFTIGYEARYTVVAKRSSGSAVDLTDHLVSWDFYDIRDGKIVDYFPVTKIVATNGHVRGEADLTGLEPGQYIGRMATYLNETNFDGYIAEDLITLQQGCDDCEPDITVGNTTNFNTFIITGVVFNASGMTFTGTISFAMTMTNNIIINNTNIIQLDNITESITYSNYFTGLGYVPPYSNAAAPEVVMSPTNGFAHVVYLTNASNLEFELPADTLDLGSMYASIWSYGFPVTISNVTEGNTWSFSSNAANEFLLIKPPGESTYTGYQLP